LASSAQPRDQGAPLLALLVLVIGVLITAVDTTIVVLALPDMQRTLHVGLGSVVWVIMGYLLVMTLLATQVGRLGDMYGRVRMYELGFFVFVLGSLLCALAWNEDALIGFRVLQGVGGAFVTANSGAVIADLFPPAQRGRAYGYTAIGWNLGAILGILAGGFLVTYLGWRWVFGINVPIGVAALAVAVRVLQDRAPRERRRVDVAGMTLLGLGLWSILWTAIRLTSHPFGAESALALLLGVAFLAAFTAVQRRPYAMLDLHLFRVPSLTPSFLAAFFQSVANFAVLFLLTMYLQGVRGLSPLSASLVLVPGYLVGSLVAPVAGRLADRWPPALPATVGLAIQALALAVYAHLGLHSPLWVVTVGSMVNGLGSGAFFPANNSAVMKAAPRGAFGVASGMLRTFANVGMVFSFSVALLMAAHTITRRLAFAIFVGSVSLSPRVGEAFLSGIHSAFYSAIAFLVVAGVLSALRWRTLAAHGVQVAATPREAPGG
jgi:EmrB/QacA subfamily drug resistance transporter